jgi:hypothetical protein
MNIDVSSSIKKFKDPKNGGKIFFILDKMINMALIKVYAVNEKGNSFSIVISKFIPYFYAANPFNKIDSTPENLEKLRLGINKLFL